MNKGDGNDWRIVGELARLIRQLRPDLVHTRNWGTTEAILAARFAGVRRVVHGEHGWSMDNPAGKSLRRRIARRILSPAVNRFVAVSDDIERWLSKEAWIRREKITKIVNGVDINKFCPGKEAEAKKRLGLDGTIVVGTVARLDPIKRCDLLLEAFAGAASGNPAAKLIIVGDGPEHRKLHDIREGLPNPNQIIFLGERQDVQMLYPSMDVFVLASKNEGISNTILEAMASGLPIIATSVGGNPELVTHEKTGLLIAPENRDALKNALAHYIRNPEERMAHGRNARADAVKRFPLERMVREYENLYSHLMA
jgi:sugar transferase (PEP-CTERM/EpsH1 system associated)